MSRDSLSAVNALRKRLQNAADKYVHEACTLFCHLHVYNSCGDFDVNEAKANAAETLCRLEDYAKTYCELGLITYDERIQLLEGVKNLDYTKYWHLKRWDTLPIVFPNISYSDTMRYVSYRLLGLLRTRMGHNDALQTFGIVEAKKETQYLNTGADLNIFSPAQIEDLQRSNDARHAKCQE